MSKNKKQHVELVELPTPQNMMMVQGDCLLALITISKMQSEAIRTLIQVINSNAISLTPGQKVLLSNCYKGLGAKG
jgi:hypothetical protein